MSRPRDRSTSPADNSSDLQWEKTRQVDGDNEPVPVHVPVIKVEFFELIDPDPREDILTARREQIEAPKGVVEEGGEAWEYVKTMEEHLSEHSGAPEDVKVCIYISKPDGEFHGKEVKKYTATLEYTLKHPFYHRFVTEKRMLRSTGV